MSDNDRLDIETKMMAALLSNSSVISRGQVPAGEAWNLYARLAVEAAASLIRESQGQND